MGDYSIFEERRRAPAHHWARAVNAWYSAHVLWTLPKRHATKTKKRIGYGGTPSIAINETYRREAALALELIIKAVVALRIQIYGESGGEKNVPAIHDVPRLWKIAGLPDLKVPDRQRLMIAAELLQWSSRYAAPRKDEHWEKQDKAWRALEALREDVEKLGRFRISSSPGFAWKDVTRIFKMANRAYWRLEHKHRPF